MDKSEELWNQLRIDGGYTKSYEEFLKQFSTPEKIEALHTMLTLDGHYTQSVEDFKNQFFPDIENQKPINEVMSQLQPDNLPELEWRNDLNYNTIPIPDKRKVDYVTNKKLTDRNKLHSNIDKDLARHIISKALENDIDPYEALAIGLQETNYHDDYSGNPFRVKDIVSQKEFDESGGDPIDASMRIMKKKWELAKILGKKGDAERIQAWNGYGKVGKTTEGNQDTVYGIDVTKNPIDMSVNPVYGKRIIDIRDNILKKNPEIVKIVDEVSQKRPE